MAGCFTWKRCILAAVLVAGLPCVAPYNYNTCSGGSVAQTCTVQYSSHCCRSGRSLSAICCQNSCSEPGSFGRSSTKTCYFRSDSMCCSTKPLGSESCCNYAEYSRTSTSSARGDYLRSTYGTCSGGFFLSSTTEYCLNSLSAACCSSGYYRSATCCRPSFCTETYNADGLTHTCHGPSTYCCLSSRTCCDSDAYKHDQYLQRSGGDNGAATTGGVFGGIILLVIIIVVPVSVVCYRARGTRGTGNPNTTVVAVTATSNQIQQPVAYYQPPPYGYSQPPPYGYSQPPPYGYSQPPPYENQPPAYNNQQWNQSSAPQYLLQPPLVPTPVEQPLPQQQQAYNAI